MRLISRLLHPAASIAGLALCLNLAAAQAPDPWRSAPDLIDLISPGVLDKGTRSARFDFRAFQGDEGIGYAGVALRYSVSGRLEADFAGDFGDRGAFGNGEGHVIRHGGADGEFSMRYQLPWPLETSIQAGIAIGDTPAQDSRVAAIAGLSIAYPISPQVDVFVNPRVVALDSNSLVGLGFGASVKLSTKLSVVGDWTPLLAGNNTVDPSTGLMKRSQLYSAGLRIDRIGPGTFVDVGYTNATGLTTGFGLTPGLGNSGAFFVSLTCRR